MVEWGIKDVVVRLLGMKLVEAEREGRIIMLYHSIAMAIVALEVYLITASVPMKRNEQTNINATMTIGYIYDPGLRPALRLLGAQLDRSRPVHLRAVGGLPGRADAGQGAVAMAPGVHGPPSPIYAHGPGGVDLERVAFFTMAVATLGSSVFGAVAGSFFGNGFQSFLAENVIRVPEKSVLELAVIGHLHIMLTLIAVALLLLLGRWLDYKGPLHKWSMPFAHRGHDPGDPGRLAGGAL